MQSLQVLTQCLVGLKPKGIEDVLNSKTGIIRKIIADHGSDIIKAMLMNEISLLCKFFNFNRTMDAFQISETADLIIELYPIYTPEDFILCFKNIKILKYGKFFEGIDGGKLLEMIQAYDIERDEQIAQVRQKQTSDFKQMNRTMHENVAEMAKAIIEKPKEKPISEPLRDLTNGELLMQGYIKEFDKLHSEQTPFQRGIKFVEYKGKKLDVQTFCNFRFSEDNV